MLFFVSTATARLQNLKPAAERLSTGEVVRNLGLRGMYKGTVVTWIRDVPYSIIFFPLYATLKEAFSDEHGHAGIPNILAAGAIAGASAALACTPADVVKTRFQAEGSAYTGIADTFRQTLRHEGAGAFFKGSIPRMSVTAPLFGIALLAFELQKRFIKGEPLF